jgi:hypothetical protein
LACGVSRKKEEELRKEKIYKRNVDIVERIGHGAWNLFFFSFLPFVFGSSRRAFFSF